MMDQLEYESLIEKTKKRMAEGDYEKAAKIVDKIPWNEVDDINVIVYAANVYEMAEKYKDAKDLLEYAYEIAPVKNRLYYSLAHISTKCRNLRDSINYYIDFCTDFPEDVRRYALQYEILKIKDAPFDQQKRVLDEYIKEENDEKMIFEMALLCDKLALRQDVIYYADHLVNFFGVKKTGYGKNALILKKKYTELTDKENKLLEDADIGYKKDEMNNNQYVVSKELFNESIHEKDRVSEPVEKVNRTTDINIQNTIDKVKNSEDELDESKVKNTISVSYTPDEDSYLDKEKNDMAFMSKATVDKEKLKELINKIKEEEKIESSPFNQFRKNNLVLKRGDKKMKYSESKIHMIIEAHSQEEGSNIAKKELEYIHEVLGEVVPTARVKSYSLNEKGFSHYRDKIIGKDLIIENAGQLKNSVMDEIEEYIVNKKGNSIFALTDVINNFDKLALDRPAFIGRFDVYSVLSTRPQETLEVTQGEAEKIISDRKVERQVRKEEPKEEKIEIKKPVREVEINETKDDEDIKLNQKVATPKKGPKKKTTELSVEEFVEECKAYATSIDCVIPVDALTALYEKAEEMKDENIVLNKKCAEAFIEEAADRAEKPKLFSKPKYDKEGCLIIKEEHFKF